MEGRSTTKKPWLTKREPDEYVPLKLVAVAQDGTVYNVYAPPNSRVVGASTPPLAAALM
jgi:hypothetical protein